MSKTALYIGLEFLFWVVTAIITAAVIYPIIDLAPDYRFLIPNIIFIVVFITCTRYIFLLQYTWLAKLQVVKTAFIFAGIYGLFLLVEQINKFQTFMDEEGPEALISNLPVTETIGIVGYIRSEMLFFGVGSVIALLVFMGRMLQSIWNYKNRGIA